MFLLPVDSSRHCLNMIMGGLRDTGEFERWTSALEEVGNILSRVLYILAVHHDRDGY